MSILSYARNFLEFRLRAFVYALFALVGFIAGMISHDGMSRISIHQLEQATKAAILERGQ